MDSLFKRKRKLKRITSLACDSSILDVDTVVLPYTIALAKDKLGLGSNAVHIIQPNRDASIGIGKACSDGNSSCICV